MANTAYASNLLEMVQNENCDKKDSDINFLGVNVSWSTSAPFGDGYHLHTKKYKNYKKLSIVFGGNTEPANSVCVTG